MILKSHSIKLNNGNTLSITEYFTNEPKIEDEIVLFLNSSFFNQDQWRNVLKLLQSLNSSNKSFRYFTYDYAGIGKSNYSAENISINQFMMEINAIVNWLGKDKIHIFGTSLGAWIGLNLCVSNPKIIKSFVGYGNLAPYLPNFKELRLKRFKSIKTSFSYIESFMDNSIEKSNWDVLFHHFYVPVFFQHLFDSIGNSKSVENTKKILSKLLFPMVKGNKIAFIPKYYEYIIDTMIKEGQSLYSQLSKIPKDIPILFMNGKKDLIAVPSMSEDLHNKILHSKLVLFEDLGHGSILLGKGNKKIMEKYIQFIIYHNIE
ncbi:alpha/beta fold hydrolase [Promethearchaeum syntrophicum]|uniref:Alpha/beta fold hydrolase n=1 Tax=Promethearchaeum syntrophicum TaxID=2594042 RepID=A0A5B9D9J2_9ARCH|nr:alpha/beta hydrolase [Candidatus Prometheoarchaeum syntrophicum]QEE15400.1 Putative aminoacrylate hydrolase RutD [Candidatus Prometheoarchaeum syntrophicum]